MKLFKILLLMLFLIVSIQSSSSMVESDIDIGKEMITEKKYQEAIRFFANILTKFSDNGIVRLYFGHSLIKAGNRIEGQQQIEQAIIDDPYIIFNDLFKSDYSYLKEKAINQAFFMGLLAENRKNLIEATRIWATAMILAPNERWKKQIDNRLVKTLDKLRNAEKLQQKHEINVVITPNPFSLKTKLNFYLKEKATLDIKIVNNAGLVIRDLEIVEVSAKKHMFVNWDGKNNDNKKVPNGIYFVIVYKQKEIEGKTKNIVVAAERLVKY